MENSNLFGSSMAPLMWNDFLERMRHTSATNFVKAIKRSERDNATVQEFLGNMEATFRSHTLLAGSSAELESTGEGLEKYVMTKLFTRIFASIPKDIKADE